MDTPRMQTFLVTDKQTGPDGIERTVRQVEILATDKEHAQEIYIDQCEAHFLIIGTLLIRYLKG